MSKQYTCELCKKNFNQKIDFIRHQNKKAPCITIDKMQELTQSKEVKIEFKNKLSTIFNYCLDVLRNNEHLTGDKALRTLAHLLDLRLLESQFGNQIDIDNYEYDFSSYEDGIVDKHKAKLLKMVRFSNLAKEKEENIPKIMKCLWDEILSVHPVTKNIFLKGKEFDIQYQSTYKKLIDKLYTFDFEAIDEDILGEAYEEVIKDVMTGKVLGQFFTPPKVKQIMIKLIDPQLKADGTIEKIFDPAMGTGGFLISSLRHLLHQSKTKGIKMNWDFISKEGLGGREAEPDTYQLAISNMLISSGHMFNVLEKGDSIRNPITNKYDIILANPPFGIDGLTYNEILHPLRNEYMPIKSNSAVPLFLQAIIHMLKINGRCALVLPYGQELQSKNSNLSIIREYLMKTCDLKEIIYLPAGIFTHTTIKTCILNFVKKREGTDVLELNIKNSKTHVETDRTYKFSKTHQTNKVKFYDYNPENDNKILLIETNIETISNNSYSLNYTDYLVDADNDINENMKSLGELCSFKSGKQLSKANFKTGIYPVIGGGQQPTGFHNEFNKEKNTILCSSSGAYAGFINKYKSEVWASDCFSIHSKNKKILDEKYLYYYLKSIQLNIYKLQTGTAQPHIYPKSVENLKIPLPSIEQQISIIDFYENNQLKINELENEIKKLKELEKNYISNMFKLNNNSGDRGSDIVSQSINTEIINEVIIEE
jgi:type I restriction-modification system DNA methylase subunit